MTPFYDLVNTRLHIPGDDFALPLEGRRTNLSLRHFQRLAARWDSPKDAVRQEAERMAEEITEVLPGVLQESGLAGELRERYQGIVRDSIRTVLGA
jgi:hypothetical protein